MSASSDEEISNGDRDGYQGGGSDGDDDEDDEEEDNAIGKKHKHRKRLNFGSGKRLVLHQFTKAKNQIRRIRSKKVNLSSNSSSRTTSFSSNIRNGRNCKFCFSRPCVLETPNGSPSSDPNDPKFTQSMLKNLIEKNDFYSKECNTHIESLVE